VNFFSLKIYETAVPKLRPRVTNRGTYTPSKTRDWEFKVRLLAMKRVKEINFGNPWEGPVYMSVSFYFKKPGYLPKRIKAHTKKPDLDNLLKSIKDALNGVVYKDDSQVIRSNESKNYLIGKNARPFVNITIECLDHDNIVPVRDYGVDNR